MLKIYLSDYPKENYTIYGVQLLEYPFIWDEDGKYNMRFGCMATTSTLIFLLLYYPAVRQ